jgi:hypothetical protein
MAHFAQLDENNVVTQVIVISNNECLNSNGVEDEAVGIQFCVNLLGGSWKQTSYSSNMRKNYAGVGFTYDSVRDAFIPPKPYASWLLNEQTCTWEPPVAAPVFDGVTRYSWDESSQTWVGKTE